MWVAVDGDRGHVAVLSSRGGEGKGVEEEEWRDICSRWHSYTQDHLPGHRVIWQNTDRFSFDIGP